MASAPEPKTIDGILLSEPILIRLQGVLLRLPAGYRWPWPNRSMRDQVTEQKRLGLQFWMPDKRYPDINPTSMIGFRPKEPGRTEPGPEAYVVNVRDLAPVRIDEPGYISPEQQFRNFTASAGLSSYSFEEEPFGLVRFWQHNWPYPQPAPFTDYRHREGSDPQVLFYCTPTNVSPVVTPFPGCMGTVHFVPVGLSFFLQFPRDKLPAWREIVFAVRDLFESWKVDP